MAGPRFQTAVILVVASLATAKRVQVSERDRLETGTRYSQTFDALIVQDNACNSSQGTDLPLQLEEPRDQVCDSRGRFRDLRGLGGWSSFVPYLTVSALKAGLHKQSSEEVTRDFGDLKAPVVWVYKGEPTTWPAFGEGMPVLLEALKCRDNSDYVSIWEGDAEGCSVGDLLNDLSTGSNKVCGKMCESPVSLRAEFMKPIWDVEGYSWSSPGHVFWYNPWRDSLVYGTDILRAESDRKAEHGLTATVATLLTHQYGNPKWYERHAVVQVQWALADGQPADFSTIFELANLNGLGGYRGLSNWYDDWDAGADFNEQNPALLRAMRKMPEMLQPWDTTMSEIRAFDVEAKTIDELMSYIHRFDKPGPSRRFVKPVNISTQIVRRETKHIFNGLLAYIKEDGTYTQTGRNCQTFAADFFAYLTGHNEYLQMLWEGDYVAHIPTNARLSHFDVSLAGWLGRA